MMAIRRIASPVLKAMTRRIEPSSVARIRCDRLILVGSRCWRGASLPAVYMVCAWLGDDEVDCAVLPFDCQERAKAMQA